MWFEYDKQELHTNDTIFGLVIWSGTKFKSNIYYQCAASDINNQSEMEFLCVTVKNHVHYGLQPRSSSTDFTQCWQTGLMNLHWSHTGSSHFLCQDTNHLTVCGLKISEQPWKQMQLNYDNSVGSERQSSAASWPELRPLWNHQSCHKCLFPGQTSIELLKFGDSEHCQVHSCVFMWPNSPQALQRILQSWHTKIDELKPARLFNAFLKLKHLFKVHHSPVLQQPEPQCAINEWAGGWSGTRLQEYSWVSLQPHDYPLPYLTVALDQCVKSPSSSHGRVQPASVCVLRVTVSQNK